MVLGVLVSSPAPGPALARHLGAGGHVGGPVGLLAGVVAVGGVPAAVEDGLLGAHGAPLLLLRLSDRFLLLRLRLLLEAVQGALGVLLHAGLHVLQHHVHTSATSALTFTNL